VRWIQWEHDVYSSETVGGRRWLCEGLLWWCEGLLWVCEGLLWWCEGLLWWCEGLLQDMILIVVAVIPDMILSLGGSAVTPITVMLPNTEYCFLWYCYQIVLSPVVLIPSSTISGGNAFN